MKRGVPGAVRVGIRAVLEQQDGDVLATARGGHDQGRGAAGSPVIDISAVVEHDLGGLDVPLPRREENRREPAC